jgi:hypothetical protein
LRSRALAGEWHEGNRANEGGAVKHAILSRRTIRVCPLAATEDRDAMLGGCMLTRC